MKERWMRCLTVGIFLAVLCLGAAGLSRKENRTEETAQTVQTKDDMEEKEPKAEEDSREPKVQTVDLMIFAGQSNMAGNGDASQAPDVPVGHGYEFRAVTDPTRLYPVEEPFGIEENREGGIYDIWADSGTRRKLGDLVPAFMNSYFETTGVAAVGVSASEGATTIDQWLPGTDRYEDMKERAEAARAFLVQSGEYELRHTYVIWCQGESDGDAGITEEAYYKAFGQLINGILSDGIAETCMVIRIGNFGADAKKYDKVMAAQTQYCKGHPGAVLISTRFAEMADTGLMRDVYHYTQEGYNLVGEEAGENCGQYSNTGKEPGLWDYEADELYVPEG